jgi:eukaryotic-like serine/threonine-protein kinase
VAAALLALVMAGLIAFWSLDPFGRDDGSAAQDPTATTSPGAAEPSTEPSDEPDTSDSPTPASESTEAPPAAAASVRAHDVDKAVKDFFELLPDDVEDAHALTSPAFQSEFPMDRFEEFWDGFEDVKVSHIQTQDGSTAATVDIEYTPSDGDKQTERHLLTFVMGEDGRLLLDTDSYQSQVG